MKYRLSHWQFKQRINFIQHFSCTKVLKLKLKKYIHYYFIAKTTKSLLQGHISQCQHKILIKILKMCCFRYNMSVYLNKAHLGFWLCSDNTCQSLTNAGVKTNHALIYRSTLGSVWMKGGKSICLLVVKSLLYCTH